MSTVLGWVGYAAFNYFYYGLIVTFLVYYNNEERNPEEAAVTLGLWPVEVFSFAESFPEHFANFTKRMKAGNSNRAAEVQTGGVSEDTDTQSG